MKITTNIYFIFFKKEKRKLIEPEDAENGEFGWRVERHREEIRGSRYTELERNPHRPAKATHTDSV